MIHEGRPYNPDDAVRGYLDPDALQAICHRFGICQVGLEPFGVASVALGRVVRAGGLTTDCLIAAPHGTVLRVVPRGTPSSMLMKYI